MSRTPKKPQKGKKFKINVELPGEVVVRIDEKAKEIASASEMPGEVITRSDVVRRAIWEYVK